MSDPTERASYITVRGEERIFCTTILDRDLFERLEAYRQSHITETALGAQRHLSRSDAIRRILSDHLSRSDAIRRILSDHLTPPESCPSN